MAAFTIAGLASELVNDPVGLGYAPLVSAGKDADVANLINSLTSPGAASVFKNTLTTLDVQGALDVNEFFTLSALQLQQLTLMITGGTVNCGSSGVRSIVVGIFSPAASFPTTRANLSALARRTGSRAEVLWGADTVITSIQVAQALGHV